MSARGRRPSRQDVVGRALLALLLLVIIPLGQLHRASNGGCRMVVTGAAAAAVAGVSHAAGEADGSGLTAVIAHRPALAMDGAHDHRETELPPVGPAPGSCGPAVLEARAGRSATHRTRQAPAEWHRAAPTVLAAPPPAPPPRLG